MGSIPPEVILDVLENTYEVQGGDVQTIRTAIRTRGPGGFSGRFQWFIRPTYRYGQVDNPTINRSASGETVCEITRLEIRLTLQTIMPRWTPPPDASEELVAQWASYERNLRIHEEGHRDIALNAARDLRNRYNRLRTANCAFMRSEAAEVLDAVVKLWNGRSVEYDETTEHGRTQGAVFPPPPEGGDGAARFGA